MGKTRTFALWFDMTEKDNGVIKNIIKFIDEYIKPVKVLEFFNREKGRLYISVNKDSDDEKMLEMFLCGLLGKAAL